MLAQHPKVCNILLSSTNFPSLPHIHEKVKLRPSCLSVYFARPEPPDAPGNILWLSFQNIPLGCGDILPAHPPSTTLVQSLVKSIITTLTKRPTTTLTTPSLQPWPRPSLHLDHSTHYHLDQAAHPPLELPLWILICPIKAPGFSVDNEPHVGSWIMPSLTGSELSPNVSYVSVTYVQCRGGTLICLRVLTEWIHLCLSYCRLYDHVINNAFLSSSYFTHLDSNQGMHYRDSEAISTNIVLHLAITQ